MWCRRQACANTARSRPFAPCRRDRADKLDKVKRNDPAYERLQDEKKRREEKKKGWKIFDPD